MKNTFAAALILFVAVPLFSLGRREAEDPPPMERSAESLAVTGHPALMGDHLVFNTEDLSYELDLRSLSCLVREGATGGATVISRAAFPPSDYRINGELTEVFYPRQGLTARLDFRADGMTLSLSSTRAQEIVWPALSLEREGTALIWPHYEGSYVPLTDAIWTDYLASQPWNTTESQYLPFWGIERRLGGDAAGEAPQTVSYIVDNPFHNTIRFREAKGAFLMDFTHAFTDNADLPMPATFTVYVERGASPIAPALHFRKILEERKAIVTLKEKMETAPLISRLIGAPHAYIWDGEPITTADVRPDSWTSLAREIVEGAASETPDAGRRIMAAAGDDDVFLAVSGKPAPYLYQRRAMAQALSRALKSRELYNPSVWPLTRLRPEDAATAAKILKGEPVTEPELVRLNSRLLYDSYPRRLNDPTTWGNGVSTRMIDALAGAGLDRFILTTNDSEMLAIRPWLSAHAAAKGFLVGPYDSYDSIHDPDAPEWPTALFDRALYGEDRGGRREGGKGLPRRRLLAEPGGGASLLRREGGKKPRPDPLQLALHRLRRIRELPRRLQPGSEGQRE